MVDKDNLVPLINHGCIGKHNFSDASSWLIMMAKKSQYPARKSLVGWVGCGFNRMKFSSWVSRWLLAKIEIFQPAEQHLLTKPRRAPRPAPPCPFSFLGSDWFRSDPRSQENSESSSNMGVCEASTTVVTTFFSTISASPSTNHQTAHLTRLLDHTCGVGWFKQWTLGGGWSSVRFPYLGPPIDLQKNLWQPGVGVLVLLLRRIIPKPVSQAAVLLRGWRTTDLP